MILSCFFLKFALVSPINFLVMKTISRLLVLVLMLSVNTLLAQEFYSVSGRVQDASNRKNLSYASIQLLSTNISNVSNSDGFFVLKVPKHVTADTILVSYLGFRSQKIAITPNSNQEISVKLTPSEINLKPVTIRPQDADLLIKLAISRIDNNYPVEPKQMTAFYREMIKKGSSYVSINEAVLDINKAPYVGYRADQLGIYKARGNYDENRVDTLMVKFQGGPNSAIEIDVAKDPFLGVDPFSMDNIYRFSFGTPVTIGDKFFYVIEFNEKEGLADIYFRGKVYIESESMAIARIEFNMNVEGRENANSYFVKKKPFNLKMDVVSAAYLVNYKEIDRIWYFDYSRTEVKFQAKWDKKWFKNNYTVYSELATTDISDRQRKIDTENRIRPKDIISNRVKDFTDSNFWGGYNIIEPDESIESVISRIVKQLKKRDQE